MLMRLFLDHIDFRVEDGYRKDKGRQEGRDCQPAGTEDLVGHQLPMKASLMLMLQSFLKTMKGGVEAIFPG